MRQNICLGLRWVNLNLCFFNLGQRNNFKLLSQRKYQANTPNEKCCRLKRFPKVRTIWIGFPKNWRQASSVWALFLSRPLCKRKERYGTGHFLQLEKWEWRRKRKNDPGFELRNLRCSPPIAGLWVALSFAFCCSCSSKVDIQHINDLKKWSLLPW